MMPLQFHLDPYDPSFRDMVALAELFCLLGGFVVWP